MKERLQMSAKKRQKDSEQFLGKTGLTPEGAMYINALLEQLQQLRTLRRMCDSNEIEASIDDLEEYIQNEVAYIRVVERT